MGMALATKAMKAMKAMKVMKAMKKAMKVSKIARGKRARTSVFKGTKEKTGSGMTKAKLMKNKNGRIVSKASSAASKKRFAGSKIQAWAKACQAARKALNLKGFVPFGGKTAAGRALYAKAKAIYTGA